MRGQGSKERVQGLGSRSCIVFEGLTRQICAPHAINNLQSTDHILHYNVVGRSESRKTNGGPPL